VKNARAPVAVPTVKVGGLDWYDRRGWAVRTYNTAVGSRNGRERRRETSLKHYDGDFSLDDNGFRTRSARECAHGIGVVVLLFLPVRDAARAQFITRFVAMLIDHGRSRANVYRKTTRAIKARRRFHGKKSKYRQYRSCGGGSMCYRANRSDSCTRHKIGYQGDVPRSER